ncbi:F-box/kelch-repeat protein At5g43190 [Humulus lupulus]|uniref:F-box/kelch-repeat protein At5g43190 n=1 Tax=Humulus lupulus TaxID=3486 RepID=UPI002B40B212|nr:F-box/kelch-repeat protein At5g43190 [Humulus lupulus]
MPYLILDLKHPIWLFPSFVKLGKVYKALCVLFPSIIPSVLPMKDERNKGSRNSTLHSPAKILSRPIGITAQSPVTKSDMDPSIWSQLPNELLEIILSFLPLKNFFNLRSTCKTFWSMVFSPRFISKHNSSLPSFSSFLLLSHPQCHRRFPLYDSNLNAWRNRALSSSVSLPSASLLTSSNGLLCFSLPTSSSFLVSNLLANTEREIKFPTYPFSFELLSLVSTPLGYTIFALCSQSSSKSTYLYDSRNHSWTESDGFDPILNDNHHQEAVYFKGALYFTTAEPFSIVSFDLEKGVWRRSEAEVPGELTFARLVSGSGRHGGSNETLYLIGGIGGNGITRSLKVWELGNEGRDWLEYDRVPEMMCRKFTSVCYHNYQHVYCFWHPGMICICCYTWPEILYFKSSRRTWHWLPKSPSLPDKWSCGFRWFSFIPNLYASV